MVHDGNLGSSWGYVTPEDEHNKYFNLNIVLMDLDSIVVIATHRRLDGAGGGKIFHTH